MTAVCLKMCIFVQECYCKREENLNSLAQGEASRVSKYDSLNFLRMVD